MKRLAIFGAGSWGTALAIALHRRFEEVRLWSHDAVRAAAIQTHRMNAAYLPGFELPSSVIVSHDVAATAAHAEVMLLAVPSQHFRELVISLRPHLPLSAYVVSATKGIEDGTLCRMSEIATAVLGTALGKPAAVLSGPTFAKEIAAGGPAAVVIASAEQEVAQAVQQAFATDALRFYTSSDVIGVEMGAALKNVIAIGAGLSDGLGLGSNSVAALITRGLAELTRLAVKLGGQPRTLSGLAGLGDLVLTATGGLSRNRYVGVELGRGRKLDEILGQMTMVAEGVATCRAVRELGLRYQVDLPIVRQVYAILYEGKDARGALRDLMERPLGTE